MQTDVNALRLDLLAWYDRHARSLPWRVSPSQRQQGIKPDPYHIWLSEIMLQQTTIAAVKPYFDRFLQAFPTLPDLAKASLDDVLALWAGLGYYARGRNLHACAKALVDLGAFPQTAHELSQLPGIGPYTSAAIASIAFDEPIVPVDGNVERVLSRLLAIEDVLPAAKPVFRTAAQQFEVHHRPGDFAQALMDLGSTICTPKNPVCPLCPWQNSCKAAHNGLAETFPRKAAKKAKSILYSVAFVHINDAGVLVSRRAEKGLLGGMLEVPNADWRQSPYGHGEVLACAPIADLNWIPCQPIRHIFTHIDLRMDVYAARATTPDNLHRIGLDTLEQAALPSVMMKTIQSGLLGLKSKT